MLLFLISPHLSSETSKRLRNSVPYHIHRDRTTRTPGYEASLFGLFEKYSESECVDKRDKVYGLLALARPCCQTDTNVNYGNSHHEIGTSLLWHHIRYHSGSLNLDKNKTIRAVVRSLASHLHTNENLSPEVSNQDVRITFFRVPCQFLRNVSRDGYIYGVQYSKEILVEGVKLAVNGHHELTMITYNVGDKVPNESGKGHLFLHVEDRVRGYLDGFVEGLFYSFPQDGTAGQASLALLERPPLFRIVI